MNLTKDFQHVVKNAYYVIELVNKHNKKYLMATFFKYIFSMLSPLVLIMFPQKIIDYLLLKDLNTTLYYVAAMIICLLSTNLLSIFFNMLKEIYTKELKASLNIEIADKTMKIPYVFLEKPDVLDRIERARATISGDLGYAVNHGISSEKGIDGVVSETMNILSLSFRLIALLYILSIINVFISILLFAVVAANSLLSVRKKRADYTLRIKTANIMRKTQYSRQTMHSFDFGKEVRLFQLHDFLISKFTNNRNDYFRVRNGLKWNYCLSDILTLILTGIQNIFVYLYMIKQAISNLITIGQFTMLIGAIANFSSSLTEIINSFLNLQLFSAYTDDYKYVMELEAAKQSGDLPLDDKSYKIEFMNVWFKYEGSDNYVISDLSIEINQNEKLSIVGENGAGKTTFIKLLLGLYHPSKGSILLNGVNIHDYVYEDYVKHFSAMFQDFEIFALTIQENIALSLEKDYDKTNLSLEKSGLYDKITSFPKSIDTNIYPFLYTDGINLSGGEKQKLAISRVFYKNSRVVILDEPTAALDPIAEYKLYKDFNNLVEDKTAIFISHRMAASRFCDRIAVFSNGKIIELGNHDELMSLNGTYNSMFRAQAKYYTDIGSDEVAEI